MALGALFLKLTPCTYCVLDNALFSVFRPMPTNSAHSFDMRRYWLTIRGLHQTERTRLCRWMVYSLATTSSMALRPWPVLPAAGLLLLVFEDIATVLERGMENLAVGFRDRC